MNKVYAVVGLVVAAVAGVVGAFLLTRTPVLGGDFAGGTLPSQLFTGNSQTASLTPIPGLPNFYVNGGISAGGVNQYNQLAAIYTASSSPSSTITLGPFGATTSTATTTFSLVANATTSFLVTNLQVGDPCSGGASTSTVVVDGCSITAVGGGNATGTLSYGNLTGAALAVPTSTVFRIILSHLPY